MLTPCFESDITGWLNVALHDIFLKEIPDFFAKEDFLLDVDWIGELTAFSDFFSGLDSHFVEHLIISDEGAHHGFEKSAIKHESGFMNETGHANK